METGPYTMLGSLRHRCSSQGGSSGSPLISTDTGKIVAIVNTSVEDITLLKLPCTLGRPCEAIVDSTLPDFKADEAFKKKYNPLVNTLDNYSQRAASIPGCFDSNGVFNIKIEGCELQTQ